MTALLVGGYGSDAGGSAPGVGWAEVEASGAVAYRGVLADAASPSWLASSGDLVLATLEAASELAAFRLSRTDGAPRLEELGRPEPTSHAACAVAIVGDEAFVAGYGDGVVSVHPVGPSGAGSVAQRFEGAGSGPRPAQTSPHAHAAVALASGAVLTADLGTDTVHVLARVAEGWVRRGEVALPPGTGPRDLLPLPDGRVAVLGEWGRTVHLLEPVAAGWRLGDGVTVPGGETDGQAAGLVASPDGRTLYAAVRGPDAIGALALDGDRLRPLGAVPCGGSWPRHLLARDGLVHASLQLSDAIASFRIADDGRLEPVASPTPAPTPTFLLPVG